MWPIEPRGGPAPVALVAAGAAVPVLGLVLLFGTGAAAAMTVARSSFLNTAVSSNRNLTAFRGRRRPKPISTKFSDDHINFFLCEIRYLDLRTVERRKKNGLLFKWE